MYLLELVAKCTMKIVLRVLGKFLVWLGSVLERESERVVTNSAKEGGGKSLRPEVLLASKSVERDGVVANAEEEELSQAENEWGGEDEEGDGWCGDEENSYVYIEIDSEDEMSHEIQEPSLVPDGGDSNPSIYIVDMDEIMNDLSQELSEQSIVESSSGEGVTLPAVVAAGSEMNENNLEVDKSESVCYTNNNNLKEVQEMASILQGLIVSKIPTDDEELCLTVKWELNAKKKAEFFIMQGAIGTANGDVKLLRSNLKELSIEGREAFLVHWIEGISELKAFVDSAPPNMDEIQEILIRNASDIINEKIAEIKSFKSRMGEITENDLEKNLYYYLRQVYLFERSAYRDEALDEYLGVLLEKLHQKEEIERSYWIEQHGDEYLKFLDSNGKIERNLETYATQRLNQELSGFLIADDEFKYQRVLHHKYLEKFKAEILAVEGVLSYLSFELAIITINGQEFFGLVGDGYLGRYRIYKPLEPTKESEQSWGASNHQAFLSKVENYSSLSPMFR